MTLTSFPRLGASGVFTDPYFRTDGAESSRSLLLPEEITSPHPCYSSVSLLDHLDEFPDRVTGLSLPTSEKGEAARLSSIFLSSLMTRPRDRLLIPLSPGSARHTPKMQASFLLCGSSSKIAYGVWLILQRPRTVQP